MTVTYLFRSPGTGFSIEELFGSVRRAVTAQSNLKTHLVRLPHISRGIGSVWRNLRYVAGLSAEVVHVTGDVHYAVLALPRSRTVLTIHDCVTLEMNRNRPVRYALFWLFWFYWPIRRAAVGTAISEKTRQDLLRYVGRVAEKVVVIPDGCDPAFRRQPRPFNTEQPVLLQIGTAGHKNLLRLIEALESINCTLVIVGPLTSDIRVALEKHRITYRHYVGLTRRAIIEQYAACDMVTLISTYEGFGMPILEANAVGRVVITSAIAPMSTVAGAGAHLVDPTDVAAIRQGIQRLIHDEPYRHKLIIAGFQNARYQSIDVTAVRYAAIYQMLIAIKFAIVFTL